VTNELVIATNVVSRDITGLDVVNSVNGFYSGAFDSLFKLVLALIALFGVILPILNQIYQKQVMKSRDSELKAENATLLEKTKTELLNSIEEKFKSEKETIAAALKKNTVTMERRFATAEGYVFHLQGNSNLHNGEFFDAAHDYCKASELYCQGDCGADLVTVINLLTKAILPRLNKEDIEKEGLRGRLDELLKQVGKVEHHGFLHEPMKQFAEAFRQTKSREPIKEKTAKT
jgi:hypothetical protein